MISRRSMMLVSASSLALGGCPAIPKIDTSRDRLVAAETGFAVAINGTIALAQEGVFKAGSATALSVNAAIEVAYGALVEWRKKPDDPSLIATAMAAINPLLNLYISLQQKRDMEKPAAIDISEKRRAALDPAMISLIVQLLPVLLQMLTAGFQAIQQMIATINQAHQQNRPISDSELAIFAQVSDGARQQWIALGMVPTN